MEEGVSCQTAYDFADSIISTESEICHAIQHGDGGACCMEPASAGNVASVMLGFFMASVALMAGVFI